MTAFNDYLSKRLKDPDFKTQYDASEPDFQITRAIAQARAYSGMTQKELSEKTGIIQAEISKMENGSANPSVKTLKKLAAGMNMRLVINFEPIIDPDTAAIKAEINEPEMAIS